MLSGVVGGELERRGGLRLGSGNLIVCILGRRQDPLFEILNRALGRLRRLRHPLIVVRLHPLDGAVEGGDLLLGLFLRLNHLDGGGCLDRAELFGVVLAEGLDLEEELFFPLLELGSHGSVDFRDRLVLRGCRSGQGVLGLLFGLRQSGLHLQELVGKFRSRRIQGILPLLVESLHRRRGVSHLLRGVLHDIFELFPVLDHQSVLLLGVSSFCLVELGHEPVGNFVSLPRRRRHARRQRAVLLVRHPAQFLLVLRLSLDELFRGCFGGGGEVGFSLGHRGLVLVRLGLELGVLCVSRLVPGLHLRRRGCCGRCEGLGVPSLRGGDGLVVLASHFVDSGVQGRDGGGAVLLGGCLCRHESFGSDVLGVLQLILESLGLLRGGLLDQRDGRGGLLLSLRQLLAPQFLHGGSLIGELSFEPGGKICLDVVHLLAKVALQLLFLVRKHQLRRVQPGDAVGHGVVHRGEHANPRLGAFRVHQRLESSPLAGGGAGLGVKRLLQRGADGLDRRVPVLLDLRLEHLDLLVLCGLHRLERLVLRGFQLGDLFVVSGLKLCRLALPVRVETLLSLGDLRGEPGADDALQLGPLAGKVVVEGAAFRPRGSKLRANSRDNLVPLRRELRDQRLLLRLELSDRGLEFLRGGLVVLGEFRDGGLLGRHEGFGGDVLGVLKRLRVVRVEHLNLGLVRPSEVLDVLIVERPLLLDAVLVIRGDGFDGGGVLRLEQLHPFAPLVRHLHLSLGDGGLDGHFQLLRRVRPLILQEHLKRLALGGRGSHRRLHL